MQILKIISLAVLIASCGLDSGKTTQTAVLTNALTAEFVLITEPEGTTIETRFNPPPGYARHSPEPASFAEYLRNLSLKPHGSPIMFYDGTEKLSQKHAAIVNMDIGKRDLQQCADVIMRIRAEYFFKRKEYGRIAFHFVNGFNAEYLRWAKGERIGIKRNNAYWYTSKDEDYSYETFREYLVMVYSFAGTASLQKELYPKDFKKLDVGDVFIQGGSPGHAMLVMDVAIDDQGQKAFILAQSYMPARVFML